MIEKVYLWLKSDSEIYHRFNPQNLHMKFQLWVCFSVILPVSAAANFGDRVHRQISGPNVNNNIYILRHEYSSTGFE